MSKVERADSPARRIFLKRAGKAIVAGGAMVAGGAILVKAETIAQIFGGKNAFGVRRMLADLNHAETVESYQQYHSYMSAANIMKGKYYVSGFTPETRDKEMLESIGQLKEQARQNSHFDKSHWEIKEEDSFYADIVRVFGAQNKDYAQLILTCLEDAETIDPRGSELDASKHHDWRFIAASFMASMYYGSGYKKEERNPEMLNLLAQLREQARQKPGYNQTEWEKIIPGDGK